MMGSLDAFILQRFSFTNTLALVWKQVCWRSTARTTLIDPNIGFWMHPLRHESPTHHKIMNARLRMMLVVVGRAYSVIFFIIGHIDNINVNLSVRQQSYQRCSKCVLWCNSFSFFFLKFVSCLKILMVRCLLNHVRDFKQLNNHFWLQCNTQDFLQT